MVLKHKLSVGILCALLLFAGLPVWAAEEPPAQSLKNKLLGTWNFQSLHETLADGTVKPPGYGPHGVGTLIFTPNNRFALMLVDPDMPKYASNNRLTPTSEEAMCSAKRTFSFFGSYSVQEDGFTLHIEGSNYPNYIGTDQKRTIESVTADQLVFINKVPPGGGTKAELTFNRIE